MLNMQPTIGKHCFTCCAKIPSQPGSLADVTHKCEGSILIYKTCMCMAGYIQANHGRSPLHFHSVSDCLLEFIYENNLTQIFQYVTFTDNDSTV